MTSKGSRWLPSSFRTRVLMAFSLSILVSALLALQTIFLSQRLSELRSIGEGLMMTRLKASEILQADKEFINNNYLNLNYYKTGHSQHLIDRVESYEVLRDLVNTSEKGLQFYEIDDINFNYIRHVLSEYEQAFIALAEKQRIRGFKDYGLEGQMRRYAHQLEDHAVNIPVEEVLMLRRHEKDFFLRYDKHYIYKLELLAEELMARYASLSDPASISEARVLEGYLSTFESIVALDNELGRNDGQGMRHTLKQNNTLLTESLADVSRRVNHLVESRRAKTLNFIWLLLTVAVVLNIGIGVMLSRTVTRPIEKLTDRMRRFRLHSSDKLSLEDFRDEDLSKEMRILITSYVRMVGALHKQVNEIEIQRIKLEQQNKDLSELNEELDKFTYSVSHDLRSPLTSMMGLLSLAKTEHPSHYELLYLNHMEDCVERLDSFVQNLLRYTRNKNLESHYEVIDMSHLVDEISKTYLMNLEKDVTIEVSAHGDHDFASDRYRIMTVMQNLLSNAIRYRHPERKNVLIKVSAEYNESWGYIEVRDNGMGISEASQARVFDMFYRDKTSTTGSGLGLYIVKKIVHRLGGSIRLESEPGVGTAFFLSIPNEAHALSGQKNLLTIKEQTDNNADKKVEFHA